MASYIPILVMIIVSTIVALVMVGGSFLLGPKKPTSYKSTSYECGITPVGTARERFPVKFYLIAMLFIVFDIETIFLYPWAVTYGSLNKGMKTFTFIEMGIFVAILFVGYFYILGKGALDWDESALARSEDVMTPEIRAKRPSLRYGNEHSGPVANLPAPASALSYGAASQEQGVVTTGREG